MAEVLKIKCTCPYCGKVEEVTVVKTEYENWKSGMLIQRAMPFVKTEVREQLISGICPACWEREVKSE